MKKIRTWFLATLLLSVSAFTVNAQSVDLTKKNYDEIIRGYMLINDFTQKEAERNISEHVFWRYPLTITPMVFDIILKLDNPGEEYPSTKGAGLECEHINRARVLFLDGKYDQSRDVLLAARSRFSTESQYHRRMDYFIALTYLKNIEESSKGPASPDKEAKLKTSYNYAVAYLKSAFVLKKDINDELLDKVAPKQLYNLAAIYFNHKKYLPAFQAADLGISHLKKFGKQEYKIEFSLIMAEIYIKNRTYLDAAKEFDYVLRQEAMTPEVAAKVFARIGDIYFDLNNYELAEDMYALSNKIDTDMNVFRPEQFVLRGETLFWLKKFSEAQKMFDYALESQTYKNATSPLNEQYSEFAALRMADCYLARNEIEKARLEYFKVQHNYKVSDVTKTATIRNACLELPYYDGNNVKHARTTLSKLAKEPLNPNIIELAQACEVNSYTERERTPEMLDKITKFAQKYPESRFLKSMAKPVQEIKSSNIEDFFSKGDIYYALSYFEKNRKRLFPTIKNSLKIKLFVAYTDTHQSEKAAEFYTAYQGAKDSDMKLLRSAVFSAELSDKDPKSKWTKVTKDLAKTLNSHKWTLAQNKLSTSYVMRLRLLSNIDDHGIWLYNLAKFWEEKDKKLTCDLVYPALSIIANGRDSKSKNMVEQEIASLIDANFPDLLNNNEECALSILDLEHSIYLRKPSRLAQKYLTRTEWPLSQTIISSIWTLAQQCVSARDNASAKKLWQLIVDKASKDSAEYRFATMSLNPQKGETEKFWND